MQDAGKNMPLIEWFVSGTPNNLDISTGIIIIAKEQAMTNDKQNLTETQMLRKKAEEQLKEKQDKSDASMIEADEKRLLHELQVHQIELEMQNEELRQAYQIAEIALKKYTMLYDFAPMGYFTLDSIGSICELNFTGAEMLGDRRFSLVNSNFKLFVTEDSKPVFNDFLRNVFTDKVKESCEVTLGYYKKAKCVVYLEGIVNDDNEKCLLSAMNISGFRKQSLG